MSVVFVLKEISDHCQCMKPLLEEGSYGNFFKCCSEVMEWLVDDVSSDNKKIILKADPVDPEMSKQTKKFFEDYQQKATRYTLYYISITAQKLTLNNGGYCLMFHFSTNRFS